MPGPRSLAAKSAAELPAVEEAVRDFRFPLASVRVDPGNRSVVLPFERKHPRPESWELVVRGARSVAVKGRMEQATDYFRTLRYEPGTKSLAIDGVLVGIRVAVDSLDVEARCLTPEEKSSFDPADLPREIRKEIEVRETESLKGRERYAKGEGERHAVLAAVGALAALVLGAGSGMPPILLPLEVAAGGAAGWWIASRRVEFILMGAALFGGPTIAISALGILLTRGISEGPEAGLGHAVFWSLMALAGLGLVVLNGKMMAEVQGLTSAWESAERAPKPLDRRIPGRAAAVVGLGGAVLFLVFHAPWTVWAAGAPLGAGGAAWLLARYQVRPTMAWRVLGGTGVALALVAIQDGAFVPAMLLLGAAHFGAGLMVSYYARGEGPR